MKSLLLGSVRGRRRVLSRLIGWSLLEMSPTLICGYAVAQAIDQGFLIGRPSIGLAWLCLVLLGVFAGAWGTRGVIPYIGAIVEPMRDKLITRVVSGNLHQAVAGGPVDTSAIARLTTQVESVRNAYAALLLVIRGFAFVVVGALLGLLTLTPAALLLTVPPLLLGLALFRVSVPRLLARQHEVNVAEERVAEAGGVAVAGLRDITATGGERHVYSETKERVDEQVVASRALARSSMSRYAALGAGGSLPLIAVVLATPWLLRQGVTTGAVLGLVTYLVHGLQPALRMLVNGVGNSGVVLTATLRRLIEATEQTSPTAVPRSAPMGRDLVLEELSFSYALGAQPVLSKIDLKIPEGDHLVVVGASGAGKSTLARLLSGLLAPSAGQVHFGEVPVTALTVSERALIPQEAYVFTGTLRENLAYLCPDATDEKLERAAATLGLAPLIARLGGLDAGVAPSLLSAGERQLIAATRTYLAPASLIVLDEATCHLDPDAEARVERAFAQQPGTLVIVAHRLSSALRAKHVLVLDGSQWWHGTNSELERSCPVYRELLGYWHTAAVDERHDHVWH